LPINDGAAAAAAAAAAASASETDVEWLVVGVDDGWEEDNRARATAATQRLAVVVGRRRRYGTNAIVF